MKSTKLRALENAILRKTMNIDTLENTVIYSMRLAKRYLLFVIHCHI